MRQTSCNQFIGAKATIFVAIGLIAALGSACSGLESAGDPVDHSTPDEKQPVTKNNTSPNNNNNNNNNNYEYDIGGYYDSGSSEGDYLEPIIPDNSHPDFVENEFIETSVENTSTFSVDVNTASYTIMRSELNRGRLPGADSVRTEEYINFFRYQYPEPIDQPFSVNMEIAPSYFGAADSARHLMRIGVKGRDVSLAEMLPSNLVFLVDVSGSMSSSNRLPLAKQALLLMLEHLRDDDTVAIQTYASGSTTVLTPTPVRERAKIAAAITGLVAEGATHAEGGIVQAYNLAEQAKIEGGNNRVIILTDGDFNVGKTGEALVDLVRDYRDRHISLTCVGFGHGNYNDQTMEALARDGNGNYFYIDTLAEAKRIFGTHLPSTIEVIAADVKLQVEFFSESVLRYRLIGYEKRLLANSDFENDAKDAGEVGPGHTVTAFYEIELTEGATEEQPFLAEVRVRHKSQYGADSIESSHGIKMSQVRDSFDDASEGFRFAAAVTEFASILRQSKFSEGARFDEVRTIAAAAAYADNAEQQEFLELVEKAKALWPE
ncbi:MAG: von Willebrand factor type A domain-containing protein [Bradymonadaceae bacterium]|nr:von Willebrand factor type A domain-containing protein [Lujinxingiaceae bacterium]